MKRVKKEPRGSFFYSVAERGFTVLELVTVLILLAILAAAALPRFWGTTFDEAKFAEETVAALRYAQRTAMAYQRKVCVTFTSTSLVLTYSSAYDPPNCDTDLASPASGTTPYTVTAPGSLVYTAANFSFDREGIPSAGQPIGITGGTTIIVEASSGYVH